MPSCENACKIGVFSNKVMLKICRISPMLRGIAGSLLMIATSTYPFNPVPVTVRALP